jgi:hypothetical protein
MGGKGGPGGVLGGAGWLGWANQRVGANAATTSHGLYKLEMVVIVDLRMLVLYFYFLINHIELS